MSKLEQAMPGMHPVLAAWFAGAFGSPTDVQRRSWEAIGSGSHTLIAAPTGSGKTLAALLPCLNRLLAEKETAGESSGQPADGIPGGSGKFVDGVPGSSGKSVDGTQSRDGKSSVDVTQSSEGKSASKPQAGISAKGVRILYITPLKALNNDIHHHVLGFVADLEQVAAEAGLPWPGIRSAVRTGDTKPSERAAMLRRPPDVLVTTPESLYLLLTSERGRETLRTVRQVIVDEIHSLAADKRGTHLSLSLERLSACCEGGVQRIGVSATQKPLERVARYLGGWEEAESPGDEAASSGTEASAAFSALEEAADSAGHTKAALRAAVAPVDSAIEGSDRSSSPFEESFIHPLGYRPRPVRIVESDMVKRYAVVATLPDQSRQLQTRDAAVWLPLLDRLTALMEGSRSVLIYVNSRRLCERLCLRLNDHFGYEIARAHHGSMSREWRLEVERMLKSGELRCIVATASLELGIDVGHVDFVIQIDPPPEAAAGIQRMGRAGHAVGDTSRGAIVARTKGALPDIAVLSRMIAERDIEAIVIPRDALGVLAQQVVAMTVERDWTADELYRLTVRSDSYRAFQRERLNALLEMQSGFYPFLRPLLDWDREAGQVTRRANSGMAAMAGAGTIPQSSAYPVHHAESRAQIGELDEEFIHESRVGDVVQLGAQAWTITDIRQDRVYATEAGNRFSEIPFWRNESPARSYELGCKIGAFQRELEGRLAGPDAEIVEWLDADFGMDAHAASELIGYMRAQQAASGIPTDRRIIIEHYRDPSGQKHVHIHNHYGRKINRTWLMAIERQFAGLVPYRIYGNAKDGGIELVFSEWDASWLHVIWQVTAANAQTLLSEALSGSPLLAVSFRRIAETSLLLARSFTRVPLWQKRLRSAELLKRALPYAERFPVFQEAMREAMNDFLDVDRLLVILEEIADGRIETVVRETAAPSPLAGQFLFEYVNMRMYEGDGLDESVQLQLLQFSKSAAGQMFGDESGGLPSVDPAVLAEEGERMGEPAFAPRHADDLLRLLKERGDLSGQELARLAGDQAMSWLAELRSRRKVAEIAFAAKADGGWEIAAGDAAEGNGQETRYLAADEWDMYREFPASAASVTLIAGRYAEHRISFTEEQLRERYPVLTEDSAASAVDTLLRQGVIEQAPFAAGPHERIWTASQVAERLVRLSIGKARSDLEPVDAARWLGELMRRQRIVAQEGAGSGESGLLAAIERLQGLYLPLSHWESIIFPSRVPDYRKDTLDLLCATGQVIWLGRKDEGEKEGKVAFFLADNRPLYEPCLQAIAAADDQRDGPAGGEGQSVSREHDQADSGGEGGSVSRERGQADLGGKGRSVSRESDLSVPGADGQPVRPGHGQSASGTTKHPELLRRLRHGGASFLTRLSQEMGRLPSEVLADLLDLVWEGQVSNDQFAPLRQKQGGRGKDSFHKTGSGLGRWYWTGSLMADESAAWRSPGTPQTATEPSAGDSGINARIVAPSANRSTGTSAVPAGSAAQDSPIVHWIHHLLQTYGVLTKDLAARTSPYSWDVLLPALKKLETWGAVTRGMFIRDLPVLQFTTRELAAEIRKGQPSGDANEVTLLASVDPANPYGLAVDWPVAEDTAFARKPGNYLLVSGDR